MIEPKAVERFWPKVDRRGPNECWPWMAGRSGAGYGRFAGSQAHRIAYELVVGPIPAGLVLDHLCRNPPCVNPAHLEPVTNQENVARGMALITHCPQGHEYTPENTKHTKRGRKCWTCRRAQYAEYRGRHRELIRNRHRIYQPIWRARRAARLSESPSEGQTE